MKASIVNKTHKGSSNTRNTQPATTESNKRSSRARFRRHNSPGARRGRKPEKASYFIQKLVKRNPRKEGSHGAKAFNIYRNGMTVQEYFAAGGRSNHLHWDIEKGYIKLTRSMK